MTSKPKLPELAAAVLSALDVTRQVDPWEVDNDPALAPWENDHPATSVTVASHDAELMALGWPPWLAKAAGDPFMYAIGLRTGLTLTFTEAERIDGAPTWVRLRGVAQYTFPFSKTIGVDDAPLRVHEAPYTFARGLEVRLTDILWVADAPFGT